MTCRYKFYLFFIVVELDPSVFDEDEVDEGKL